jgi:SulP family sulfate permease
MNLVRACQKKQVRLILCGLVHQPLDMAQRCGLLLQVPEGDLFPDLPGALTAVCG